MLHLGILSKRKKQNLNFGSTLKSTVTDWSFLWVTVVFQLMPYMLCYQKKEFPAHTDKLWPPRTDIRDPKATQNFRASAISNKPLAACKISTAKKICLLYLIKIQAGFIWLWILKIYSRGCANINPKAKWAIRSCCKYTSTCCLLLASKGITAAHFPKK